MTLLRIGLDPGVHTGYAVWNRELRALVMVTAFPIHKAMREVEGAHEVGLVHSVVFEDARQRTWFGAADARQAARGAGVREGVGSVKRDCAIWEAFLTDLGVPFEMRKPAAGTTKWAASYFNRVAKWTEPTNQHGRDAAVLLLGA